MHRFPRVVKVVALLAAAVMAGFAGGRTTAEFSATTANSANSFSAAASFGAAVGTAAVVKSGAGSTSYTAGVLADSPVAYWRFGESAGTTAVDAGGNGNHGVIATTAPMPTLGVNGLVGDGNTAYRFADDIGGLTFPHAAALRLNGSFTIELWLQVFGVGGGTERVLWDKNGTADADGWQVTYDTAGTLRLRRNSVAFASATLSFVGAVRHLVVTYDGSNVKWYLDGALSTSTAATFPASTGTGDMAFARSWADFTDQATVDEPALYAIALSAERINAHYRAGRMLSADVCEGFRVYANITDGGSPATGVTSVTANLTSVSPGATAVPLTAGNYTVGGVAYGYRSASLRTGVAKGSYGYQVTWVDGSGSHTRSNLTAVVGDPIPITTQWMTGFEHGVASTPDLFSANVGTGINSFMPKSGSYGRSVPKVSGVSTYLAKDGFTTTTALSFAVRMLSLPTGDVTSLAMFNTTATPLYLGFQASSGKLTLRWGANAAAVALSPATAGTWHTVDLLVDVSGATNTASWRIDEVDQASVALSGAAQTVTDVRFGSAVSTDVFTAHYDDIVHSRATADYPIGPVRVLPSRPNGMGTHSLVANFSQEDGTAITSTSWDRLDDPMMNSATDGVRQNSSSGYLTVEMQDTTEVCVRGVQAVVAQHKTAAQANSAKAGVWVNHQETVVSNGDSTFVTNAGQKTAPVITSTAGGWRPQLLNSTTFRLGEASDANPAPYWDALLLEYATSG